MSIQVALHHKTEYHYDRLVTMLPQVIRLRPAHCRTKILSYSLRCCQRSILQLAARPVQQLPSSAGVSSNRRAISPSSRSRRKWSRSIRSISTSRYAAKYPFSYEANLAVELHPYLEIKERGPLLLELVREMRLRRHRDE